MENETTQLLVHENQDIFHLLDAEDERQIIAEAQGRLKEALVYTTKKFNKNTNSWEEIDQLSYTGIQHITIMMAQQYDTVGALEIVGEPKIEIQTIKYFIKGEEQTIQKWTCSLNVRNTKTGMVTPGVADANVVEFEKFDDFGRNKALSKAFRNACKIQIPQSLILEMIKIAKEKGKTKTITETEKTETKQANCFCGMKDMNPSENKVLETGLFQCKHCACPISEARMKAYLAFKEQK